MRSAELNTFSSDPSLPNELNSQSSKPKQENNTSVESNHYCGPSLLHEMAQYVLPPNESNNDSIDAERDKVHSASLILQEEEGGSNPNLRLSIAWSDCKTLSELRSASRSSSRISGASTAARRYPVIKTVQQRTGDSPSSLTPPSSPPHPSSSILANLSVVKPIQNQLQRASSFYKRFDLRSISFSGSNPTTGSGNRGKFSGSSEDDEFSVCSVFAPVPSHASAQDTLMNGPASPAPSTGSADTAAFSTLSTSASSCRREGYLYKLSGHGKNSIPRLKPMKRRYYFVLQNRSLFYFKSHEEAHKEQTEPLAVIPLDGFFGLAQQDLPEQLKSSDVRPEKRKKSFLKDNGLFWWRKRQPWAQPVEEKENSLPVGTYAFNIETTNRVWSLAADTEAELLEWMQALQNVFRHNQSKELRRRTKRARQIEGEGRKVCSWLEKHQRGTVSTRWFVLNHDRLDYYRSPDADSEAPMGTIPLHEAHLEVAYSRDDSDNDDVPSYYTPRRKNNTSTYSSGLDLMRRKDKLRAVSETCRFAIHTPNKTYWFRTDHLDDMEEWVSVLLPLIPPLEQHLTATERVVEHIVQTILEGHDDCNLEMPESKRILQSLLDDCPETNHSSTPIPRSLTTLGSERLVLEAIQCFDAIRLFSNIEIQEGAFDYHVALVQSLTRKCLHDIELQNEVVLQVIKQIYNCPDEVMELRLWQLLSLLLGVFIPTRNVYPYARLIIVFSMMNGKRNASSLYATYSFYLLDRALNGRHDQKESALICRTRVHPPSRFEMESVLSMGNMTGIKNSMTDINVEILKIKIEFGVNSEQYLDIAIRVHDTVRQTIFRILDAIYKKEESQTGQQYRLLSLNSVELCLLNPLAPSMDPLRTDCLLILSLNEFMADVLMSYESVLKVKRPNFNNKDDVLADELKLPRIVLRAKYVMPPFITNELLLANGLADRADLKRSFSCPSRKTIKRKTRTALLPPTPEHPEKSLSADHEKAFSDSLFSPLQAQVRDLLATKKLSHLNISARMTQQSNSSNSSTISDSTIFKLGGCFFPESFVTEQLMSSFVLADVSMKPITFQRQRGNSIDMLDTHAFTMTLSIGSLRWQAIKSSISLAEKRFLCYHVNEEIRLRKYPVTPNSTLRLAALMAQMEWGDHYPLLESTEESKIPLGLLRFHPELNDVIEEIGRGRRATTVEMYTNNLHTRLMEHQKAKPSLLSATVETKKACESVLFMTEFSEQWSKLRGYSADECMNIYLSHTMQWPIAAFYETFKVDIKSPSSWKSGRGISGDYLLAVGVDGIAILSSQLMTPLRVYPYQRLINYGHKGDTITFMVDVTSSPSAEPTDHRTDEPPVPLVRSRTTRRRGSHIIPPEAILFSPSKVARRSRQGSVDRQNQVRIGTLLWEIDLLQVDYKGKHVIDLIGDCVQAMAAGQTIHVRSTID